jgi:hypothetical protein
MTKTNAGTCPDLNCYDTDKTRPWFVQTDIATGACSAEKFYRGSKQCVCDTAGTSVTKFCVDGANNYVKGDTFAPSTDPADQCNYLRKDYINYNTAVNLITGKNENDDYFCCTEENVNQLFDAWSSWDDSACVVDGNTCGCVNDGENGCGLQTRRRALKCPDFKVDDTTCPCVEVRKCDLPKCPKQGPWSGTSTCQLDASLDNRNFQVRQCCNTDAAYRLPWDFTGGNQFSKNGCDWCPCNDQVSTSPVGAVCGAFDTDCDGLIWGDWGECDLGGDVCGVGTQARMRKCGAHTTLEAVMNHCYNPRVRRHKGAAAVMTADPDYYELRSCAVPCPNYSSWTACSGSPGQAGMQIRFDLDDSTRYDVKSCVSGLGGVMKSPETHFGECNVACGVGKRHKIVHDFTTGVTSIVEEDCEMAACTAEIFECPEIVVVTTTTIAPTVSIIVEPTVPVIVVETNTTQEVEVPVTEVITKPIEDNNVVVNPVTIGVDAGDIVVSDSAAALATELITSTSSAIRVAVSVGFAILAILI